MMLSPRKHYVTPTMQSERFDHSGEPMCADTKAAFDGLSPAQAAKLFGDLMKAQV